MDRNLYPSDLTDEQWSVIEALLPPAKPGGRHREVNLREEIIGNNWNNWWNNWGQSKINLIQ